jgi:parallel beta-helix repeat protein
MTYTFKLARRNASLCSQVVASLGLGSAALRKSGSLLLLAAGVAASACNSDDSTGPADPGTQQTAQETPALSTTGTQVTILPGQSIQAKVNSYPAGTSFLLKAGTYYKQSIVPKSGDIFVGEAGAILDGQSATAYAFDHGGTPHPNNVQIKGLIIQHYAPPEQQGAIMAGGPNRSQNTTGWLIQNCEVRYNETGGIRIGEKTRILDNFVHHNKQLGIMGSGDSVLVEGNEISYNNWLKIYPFGIALGGGKFVNTQWLIVRGNNVHDNQGNGLWTDIGNRYALIENNLVESNSGAGIMHEISYDATIRNNTARGNGFGRDWVTGAGILISASANVTVYGNTVTGNKQGIVGIQQNRVHDGVDYSQNLKNMYIHDNTVLVPSGGVTGIASISNLTYTSRNNRYIHNTYDLGSDATPFTWMNGQRTKTQWQGYGEDVTGTFK